MSARITEGQSQKVLARFKDAFILVEQFKGKHLKRLLLALHNLHSLIRLVSAATPFVITRVYFKTLPKF